MTNDLAASETHPVRATISHDKDVGFFQTPEQRLGVPEFVDWHMILDNELSQLTTPETGVLGSVGFVGLGAAAGFTPALVRNLDKVLSAPPIPLGPADLAEIIAFVTSVVLAVVCLVLFAISAYRNRGLSGNIRARKKSRFPSQAQ